MDDERTTELHELTERRGRSFFRADYSIMPGDGVDRPDTTEECPLDAPHVIVDVDSPASYCKACGSPMQIRMARFAGYDPHVGLPQYRLVRACPKASFYELCGLVWQTDLRRHTVQGPTDTRVVLGALLAVLVAVVALFVVPELLPKEPAKTLNIRY